MPAAEERAQESRTRLIPRAAAARFGKVLHFWRMQQLMAAQRAALAPAPGGV